jgi:hypothetical protein
MVTLKVVGKSEVIVARYVTVAERRSDGLDRSSLPGFYCYIRINIDWSGITVDRIKFPKALRINQRIY